MSCREYQEFTEKIDADMFPDFASVNYRPPRKRQKLIDDFEALSLQDEEEVHEMLMSTSKDSSYSKSNYSSIQLNCGGIKRRVKENMKSSIEDFSEFKNRLRDIDEENQFVGVFDSDDSENSQKNNFSGFSSKKKKCIKKRHKKSVSKENRLISVTPQSNFERTVLKYITNSRICLPKLYDRLNSLLNKSPMCSISGKNVNLENKALDYICSLNDGKSIVNKFIKRLNRVTIRVNSRVADEVMTNLLSKLECDYEMSTNDSVLRITNNQTQLLNGTGDYYDRMYESEKELELDSEGFTKSSLIENSDLW